MAIGILIISAVILMRFKIVYTVYIDEQEIGCIQDKKQFEKLIEENLYDNSEENIAFSEINKEVKYIGKLVGKDVPTTEQQVISLIKESSDITYTQYAVNVAGKERKYLKTEEEAIKVRDELIKKLGENAEISTNKVYTKELKIEQENDIAAISDEIIEEIRKEEKIKASTINGIYLAVNPIEGHITSRYGSREAIRDHTHQGLDIAAKTGTPIKATANGTVTFSGEKGGYGNLVILEHGNGIQTYYGHCSKLYVKAGYTVTAGDVIAAVGSTGNSTGPHLHFEIRQYGKYVNPQRYLYN